MEALTILNLGIDIGSTTVKVLISKNDKVIYHKYERHFSQVRQKALEMVKEAEEYLKDEPFKVAISGSAGYGLAKKTGMNFVQEVYATSLSAKQFGDDIDVIIELGGEDAKILFLTGGLEERMNGSCAGGTGAFIDQMASLLSVTPTELDELSYNYKRLYPIASRCGVFAKSDIQPLLNQGAPKEDLAASIFQAVVDQTVAGLAQGRQIKGKVLFLGGPLYFFKGLQQRFVESLDLSDENAVFPDLGLYAVSMGAAIYAETTSNIFKYNDLIEKIELASEQKTITNSTEPLFANQSEYDEFITRHSKASVEYRSIDSYSGDAFLGIDCGSTTTKLMLISIDKSILYEFYSSNEGNPIEVVKQQLIKIYELCGNRIKIKGSTVTGYGEDLIKNAFSIDAGIVETMAHFRSASHFNPNVDFILDIGGQDIKCFKVRNNSIDSIMLNEACSSGCGSFVETFAKSMGYGIAEFSKKGLFAKNPVDLGSRCTVFMNSSVKQAQKDGANVEDTSAGLSISVVKNVVYKVIRARNPNEFGKNIVVQGGTFLNDAVLRSFEKEIKRDVIRPQIAGLMGAYGAALYAMSLRLNMSSIISPDELKDFKHTSKAAVCQLCGNRCSLTINNFDNGQRFISGNKCERPNGINKQKSPPNIYEYKLDKIRKLNPSHQGTRGKIGIPLGLNMYENLHFWSAFLTSLGFEVVISSISTRKTYMKGQYSIPSDTVCYPAKLMHGHIEDLLDKGITTIFYPCLTYNFDEENGDNHFNCPVVAYYPELLNSNVSKLKDARFLYPFFGVHRRNDFEKKAYEFFKSEFDNISFKDIKLATKAAFKSNEEYLKDIREQGKIAIDYANKNGLKIIVLAGRPYHIDPEINHGIDRLINSFDIVVVSEDCVSDIPEPQKVNVLNQWTYHSRLYNAAQYVSQKDNMELIQLVSFGCGLDSITSDEVKEILEDSGNFYTQLKIDEISNLGAVKIRIRSLLGAIEEREKNVQRKV